MMSFMAVASHYVLFPFLYCHPSHLPFSDSMSENAKAFMLRCFEKDPEERATAEELLEDPFLHEKKRGPKKKSDFNRFELIHL